MGRFLNSDPARSGVDWYEYALDNPLKYIDPTGLENVMDAYKAEVNVRLSRGLTDLGLPIPDIGAVTPTGDESIFTDAAVAGAKFFGQLFGKAAIKEGEKAAPKLVKEAEKTVQDETQKAAGDAEKAVPAPKTDTSPPLLLVRSQKLIQINRRSTYRGIKIFNPIETEVS